MADITEGMSLITSVTTLFVDAIRAAFPDFPVTASDALVGYGMKHDYQCNAAMGLTKKLQAAMGKENAPKNPRECGQRIIDHFPGAFVVP